jgi:hypothetical protein
MPPVARRAGGRLDAGACRIAGLVLSALLFGCAGDSTRPETRREITLHGFLYVGETIDAHNAIRIGRVGPIDEYYDESAAAVSDAIVLLAKEGATAAETLRLAAPGAYVNSRLVIEPRTTYVLSAMIPGGPTLTARTTTPSEFVVHRGPPNLPDSVRYEALAETYPVDVECADPEQVFVCDVYCLERWEDARYINPFGPHDRPNDYEEYGGSNGEPRHIFAYFRIKDVALNEQGEYRIDFYSAMMAFYGLYDVNVLSIDENTYNWLYRDHPEENGGVSGGIGVLGSACRRTWSLRVVE